MNIGSLMGLIAFLGLALFIGGIALAINNATNRRSARPGVLLSIVGVVIAVVFFIFSSGIVQVESNEVAVVFQPLGGDPSNGRLSNEPLGPGLHIVIPYLNVPTVYSTRLQTYTMSGVSAEGALSGDDAIKARTKDGQQVDLDVSVLYGVSPQNVNTLHRKWQGRFQDEFVRPTSREAVREVVSGYGVEEIYGEKRGELKNKLIDSLKSKFESNGLTLNDVLVRNITFSPEYIKAIEQKQVAVQDAERAKQEADRLRTQAQGQADAAVLAAKGESDSLAARVKGEAEAIRLRAQAEADALGYINAQLQSNPLLLQYTYVQKLSDKVSLMLIPSNSPFLFDFQSMLNAARAGSAPGAATATPQAPATTPAAPAATPTPKTP